MDTKFEYLGWTTPILAGGMSSAAFFLSSAFCVFPYHNKRTLDKRENDKATFKVLSGLYKQLSEWIIHKS